ncbi:MAG: hypothetical protein QXO67_03085 [Candidatus Bathyarchaeia archaeon]
MTKGDPYDALNISLSKAVTFFEVDTQNLRRRLLAELEAMFDVAVKEAARNSLPPKNKQYWMRLAGFLAQTINRLAESFDETQMDQDLKQLREFINQLKQKHGAPYTEQ